MNGSENKVAGERGLDSDLRGFLVADFADHDLIGIVTQNGTQAAREGKTLFLVDGDLRDAAKLIFDRIFDGDDFVFVGLDLVNGGVESGGLARTRRAGNQDHSVGFADIATETAGLFRGETDNVQGQAGEFFRKGFLVEDAENGIFAVTSGHDGDAQIDVAPLVFHAEAAVLGHAPFGNVQIAKHFDAREHRGMPFLGDGLHGMLQNAIDAVFDGDFRVPCFDVDVTGAALERGKDYGFDETHDRAGGAIASQTVAGNGLLAFLFFLGSLQSESFGGLFEDALRLLGAFEDVANLAGGSDANQKFFAEEERELIAHLHLTGIGSGDGQNIVAHFKRDEVVAEHQIRGDGTKKLRVDALLPKIDEGETVPFRKFARKFAFVLFVTVAGKPGAWRKLFRGSHESLLCRSRHRKREDWQIE